MLDRTKSRGRLLRYPEAGYVGGVCAGVGAYLGWSVRLIRVLAILTLVFGGIFPIVLVYALLWYLMPSRRGRPDDGDAPETATGVSRKHMQARFARIEQRLGRMEECVTSGDYDLRRELRKLET